MTPNWDLINRVVEQIDSRPETWNQGVWKAETKCGTAYCFAGWTAAMEGARWHPLWSSTLDDGTGVWAFAHDHLGLSGDQSEALFRGDNSREVIEDVLDMIREGAL